MKPPLTVESIYDIAGIASYIEIAFGEKRAVQFQIGIEQRPEKLEQFTLASTGILCRGHPIHKDVFSPSLVFLSPSKTPFMPFAY